MSEMPHDIGVLTVLAKRLVEERLPKALNLQERVNRGEVLNDLDLNFLEQVLTDAKSIAPIVRRYPQYHDVASRVVRLYKEIMDKALENETAKKGS